MKKVLAPKENKSALG